MAAAAINLVAVIVALLSGSCFCSVFSVVETTASVYLTVADAAMMAVAIIAVSG